jgi:anti-sigma regulatory factor (Ser/Thr protein kinase)
MEARSRHRNAGHVPYLDLQVPAMPRMVAEVRRAVRKLPLPAPMLEDALLLVSELVTNSIRHAGLNPDDPIRVCAGMSGGRLRVDVIDGSRVSPRIRIAGAIRPAPGAESGWGLYFVNHLAARWGHGPGRYWFELEFARQPED